MKNLFAVVLLSSCLMADAGFGNTTVQIRIPAFAANEEIRTRALASAVRRARLFALQALLDKGPVLLGNANRGCVINGHSVTFHFRGIGRRKPVHVCGKMNNWNRAHPDWLLVYDVKSKMHVKTMPLTDVLADSLTFVFVAGGEYAFAE